MKTLIIWTENQAKKFEISCLQIFSVEAPNGIILWIQLNGGQ